MDPICIGLLLGILCQAISMMFGLVDSPWKEAWNKFSHEDNGILPNFFDIHINQEVDDFVKQKLEEWDFAMATTKMNKEHFCFYGF